jgi:DNA-binding LacI/PurR family transcriptional regulator
MIENGIQVPEEIALVAVDNVPSAFSFKPFLAVVKQTALAMVRKTAKLLLGRIKVVMPHLHLYCYRQR